MINNLSSTANIMRPKESAVKDYKNGNNVLQKYSQSHEGKMQRESNINYDILRNSYKPRKHRSSTSRKSVFDTPRGTRQSINHAQFR